MLFSLALIAILIPTTVASVLLSNTLTGSFNTAQASVILSWNGRSPNDDGTLLINASYNYYLRIENPSANSINNTRVVLHVSMSSNCPDGAFKVRVDGTPISWSLKSGPDLSGNTANSYTYNLLNNMTIPAHYNSAASGGDFEVTIQLTADAPLCQYTYQVYAEMVHR